MRPMRPPIAGKRVGSIATLMSEFAWIAVTYSK
jgi:hypothetical protein